MLHDRLWIVLTHNASCCLLDAARSFPRLVDVFSRKLLQQREVLPVEREAGQRGLLCFCGASAQPRQHVLLDVVSIFVRLFAKGHRRVNPEELVEKGTGREPQPVPSIQSPVSVQQKLLEHLRKQGMEGKKSVFLNVSDKTCRNR